MKSNFAEALEKVLKHEGGYVNHPKDPGGATNKGVTQGVYDAFRRSRGENPRSVKNITSLELTEIYKKNYWDKICGDQLPSGVDYAVFDFAVNSGPQRAAYYLQQMVGVVKDGEIGPKTVEAVKKYQPKTVIIGLCTLRLIFLRKLRTFPTFGKGWTKRVNDVRDHAIKMR